MTSHTIQKSSTAEAEKILRAIMLADCRVLSRRHRRALSDETHSSRVLSDATREKLREAGRRGAIKTNTQKSQPAKSPGHNPGRTNYA